MTTSSPSTKNMSALPIADGKVADSGDDELVEFRCGKALLSQLALYLHCFCYRKSEYANGDSYEGAYAPHFFSSTIANLLLGEYVGSLRHGQGTYRYAASGDVYTGTYVRGSPNGQGTFKFGNGNRYEGALFHPYCGLIVMH